MNFGIIFTNVGPFIDPDQAAGLARIVEEAGFESLWAVEHVVVPSGYKSTYPYSPDGKMPGGDNIPIADPIVWLTYVAAVTERIRLATGILILSQRNPVITAKAAATLDVLSRGRLTLGVGVGWLREEFEAIGAPFEERGARVDEYIAAMKVLWRDDEATFEGRFSNFKKANLFPKPIQKGGVPVVIGGHSDAAARRAGRLGNGFFPGRFAPGDTTEFERLLGVMRAAAEEAGRDADTIEITTGGAFDIDGAKRLADLGVSRIVLPPLGFDLDTLKRSLGDFSERVIAPMS